MTAKIRPLLTIAIVAVFGWITAACQQAPITGRDQFIIMSDAQANAMGLQAYHQILSKAKLSTNQEHISRVRTIGQRIANVSGQSDFKWEFNVIEDKTPNAFALPGGKVGVHTGLFTVAKDDNQLAAVMAHEVGHAIARHGSERISTQMAVQFGLIGLSVAAGQKYAPAINIAAGLSTLAIVLPHTRTQESEADHVGLILMAKAGYDPRAAVPLWENFKKAGGPRPPEFLSTHPAPQTRIDRIREILPTAMKIYNRTQQKQVRTLPVGTNGPV